MKRKRLNQIVLSVVFGFSVILTACTEKEGPAPAPENHATVIIDSPKEGALIGSNNTLTISGIIRGEQDLGGYAIYIRRKSDNALIFERRINASSAALPFNEQWATGKIITATDLELEVVADLGATDGTYSQKVNLRAIP